MAFPLTMIPKLPYRHLRSPTGKEQNGRAFGAERSGGRRLHAACDLIAPKGTPIRAIEDGVVLEGPKPFYSGTYSLVVRHQSGVVRYGEIDGDVPDEIRPGAPIKAGQVIAKVGQLNSGSSMLHFELYAGTLTGPLTVRANPDYQRRKDLIDPTDLLDRLARADQTAKAAGQS